MDKHFISQYIKTREGYYFNTLQQEYELTQMMSSDEVAKDYRSIYEGKNARDQKLGFQHFIHTLGHRYDNSIFFPNNF